MMNKRSFADDNSYEVSSKHPRHFADELVPNVDNVVRQKSFADDEGDGCSNICPYGGSDWMAKAASETKEFENYGSGSISHYLWVNSSIFDSDGLSSHLSFFPEYFEHTDPLRALIQPDDVHTSPVDHPPQKLVPIGPEYQANVPEWSQKGSSTLDHHIELFGMGHGINADEEKMGICMISMPKPDFCSEEVVSRDICECLDKSSVRCVRQHVMEAREKLKEKVGAKVFEDLGFCEMGEDVAKQWTEEEERIFHEVVLANPLSLGRNFWDHLSVSFPNRTRKDLVSYYFNVFILRKRAGQNRFDPSNIDSDNDEWQQTELGVLEDDDDDSVVESPTDQDTFVYCQEDHVEVCHEDLEYTNETDACDDGADTFCRVGVDEEDDEDTDDGSGTFINDSHNNYCDSKADLLGKNQNDNGEDQDVHDDSCTSYEFQGDRIDICCPLDKRSPGTDGRDCHVG